MASGQDIAGIAALAGLGYMLANRKKKEAEDTSSKADIASMKQDASSAGDESAEDTQKLPIRPGQQRSGMMMPTRPGQQRSGVVPAPVPSGGPGRRPSGPGPGAGRGGQGGPNVPTTAAMPPVGSGRGGQGGPQAGDADAYRQQQYEAAKAAAATPEGQAARKKQAESEAIEPVYPEQMIGMPGVKAVAGVAKALANRGAAAAPAAAQGARNAAQQAMDRATAAEKGGNWRSITNPADRETARAQQAWEDLQKSGIAKPQGAAGRNPAQQAMDRAMDAEMAARTTKGTVPRPASQAPTTEFNFKQAVDAQNRVKNQPGYKQMLENEMRDADLPYKRGGKVKAFASGGSVKSSASSRGDGIASRGKTRGRIY